MVGCQIANFIRSGIASIVKTALLGAVGDKMDMTCKLPHADYLHHTKSAKGNVIVFELWVK